MQNVTRKVEDNKGVIRDRKLKKNKQRPK